ncbi:MAG: hypothetical protein SGJ20_15665 [Planctomycetota bacterium]|nr:hypothetical protein [Planctomycetota bacterium]
MRRNSANRRIFTPICLLILSASFFAESRIILAQNAKPGLDSTGISTIRKVTEKALSETVGYQPGDLISQSQARKILLELVAVGMKVPNASQILARVPADDEFLVTALRTDQGMKFMRQVATLPTGFDRVDHLSRIPNGQGSVLALIKGPDGYLMIKYMTNAPGGKELGKMLTVDQGGKDFNGSTGRIYTANQLVEQIIRELSAKPVTRKS